MIASSKDQPRGARLTHEANPHAVPSVHESALARLDVGVCVWELEEPGVPASLRLVACNPAAARFLGVELGAVLGRLPAPLTKQLDDALRLHLQL